jgi:GNAT superfamily N-acetyltransferase
MSGSAPIAVSAGAGSGSQPPPAAGGAALPPGPERERERAGWRVRAATGEDVPAVAAAVGELLRELGGGARPAVPAMEAAARELVVDDRKSGVVLVAESAAVGAEVDGEIAAPLVGLLAASWPNAIHIPGRYALIQDLWVRPPWRGAGVGAGLLAALFELARERGFARVEVGLPDDRFAGLAATEAFYLANGFTALGPRMRRRLA